MNKLTSLGQCIAIVSGKGGTGKSSFTAGVGAALAQRGKRVLCLDCDVGLRNLDLTLGIPDQAFMDFSDVIHGRCTLENAVVAHSQIPNLYLLTAPVQLRHFHVLPSQMIGLLREVRQYFDICLLDAPAGLGTGFELATCGADRVVVVSTSDPSALRDAQHTVMTLSRFDRESIHLVVNRVRKKLLRNMHTTIDDAIDCAGLPLLGVVPEDDDLPLCQSHGVCIITTRNRMAASAYRNIAQRILGKRTPLLRIR